MPNGIELTLFEKLLAAVGSLFTIIGLWIWGKITGNAKQIARHTRRLDALEKSYETDIALIKLRLDTLEVKLEKGINSLLVELKDLDKYYRESISKVHVKAEEARRIAERHRG